MKKKAKISTIVIIVLCIIGLSLLLYPTFANFWNTHFATHAVTEYINTLGNLGENEYQKMWNAAVDFNKRRAQNKSFFLPDSMINEYNSLLDVSGNGVMGYIEIPKIDTLLPIYHGTSDTVLNNAIGHLDWSSLPVGGESTHCVVSGHRGLASAKILTDLDELREGDIFTLTIMSEILTYEVDQIRTVEPTDLTNLSIVDGKDYCTIVTCTPYGINTHRLLVRGHRIENISNVRILSEAVLIDPLIVAPVVAFPFLFTLLMIVMLKKPESQKNKKQPDKKEEISQ